LVTGSEETAAFYGTWGTRCASYEVEERSQSEDDRRERWSSSVPNCTPHRAVFMFQLRLAGWSCVVPPHSRSCSDSAWPGVPRI